MGYFLDYELFTPCWKCGRTDCNGDHPEATGAFLPSHGSECDCFVCENDRETRYQMSTELKVSNNLSVFLQDGPRMSTRYQTYVCARDRSKKTVLVGGLGCVGVGRMWMSESSCADMDTTEMETAQ